MTASRFAIASVALVALLASYVSASAAPAHFRVGVSPRPTSLDVRSWSPTITLAGPDGPVAAPLTLTIRNGARQHAFRPRATQLGSYRARVVFPSDGLWRWTLSVPGRAIARGAISVVALVTFELPYDLAVLPDGRVLVADRSRILELDPSPQRLRVHATLPTDEVTAFVRVADGTLFAADFPGGRVLRVDPAGRVSTVARVPEPADIYADPSGRTLWVASIADDVGVVRVDVASGTVQPFAKPIQPHGIDRGADGDFYVHDGHAVSRIDGDTGAVSHFASVDAFKLVVTSDGSVYGVEATPAGGRIVRIASTGAVTTIAGTGSLGPHRDGPALEARILPSAIQFAPDGSLLVAQVQPVPAIRRVDLATGRITTVILGR